MPVVNQQTPTVTVQVPVPQPANIGQASKGATQPRKPKRPTSFTQEDRGGSSEQQPQQPVQQPQPVPRAIILPWAPNTGKAQVKLRRLPKRVIKMAKSTTKMGLARRLTMQADRSTRDTTFYTDREHINNASRESMKSLDAAESSKWAKAARHHYDAATHHNLMTDQLEEWAGQASGPFSQGKLMNAAEDNRQAAKAHLMAVSEALATGGYTGAWKPGDSFPFPEGYQGA